MLTAARRPIQMPRAAALCIAALGFVLGADPTPDNAALARADSKIVSLGSGPVGLLRARGNATGAVRFFAWRVSTGRAARPHLPPPTPRARAAAPAVPAGWPAVDERLRRDERLAAVPHPRPDGHVHAARLLERGVRDLARLPYANPSVF